MAERERENLALRELFSLKIAANQFYSSGVCVCVSLRVVKCGFGSNSCNSAPGKWRALHMCVSCVLAYVCVCMREHRAKASNS